MHYSVEASLGNQLALEYVIPVSNRQLACQDECLAVIPVVDDLLEVVLYLPFEPDHAEVVDNEQVVGGELAEEVGLTPFQMYQPQLVDERVHREVERLVALAACPLSQGIDKEGLARACRAYYNSEPRVTYVATCGLFGDIGGGQPTCGVHLQFLDSGLLPEACVLDEPGNAVRLACVALMLQHQLHAVAQ